MEVWAFGLGQQFGKHWVHHGIEYRVSVLTETHETATTRAVAAVENVSNLLSITHAAGIDVSEATWTVDLDEASADRVLVQHFINVPTLIPTPRDVDHSLVGLMASYWSAKRGDPSIEVQLRRAMWHLRKSAMVDDLVEEFNEIWLGLESVNHSLISKHSLRTTFIARNCRKCGAPMEVVGSSAGITFAITELAGGSIANAKTARELRKTLHHGLSSIYVASEQFPIIVPLLRNSLTLALADLMEVPRKDSERLVRRSYVLRKSGGEVTVRVTLHDLPTSKLLSQTSIPEITLAVVQQPEDEHPDVTERRRFGHLAIGVVNHEGTWGGGSITERGHGDPDAFGELLEDA